MTDKEKVEKMWFALNNWVVEYVFGMNGENPIHTVSELIDMGFSEDWLYAFGFDDEDIDYGLGEWKEENGFD